MNRSELEGLIAQTMQKPPNEPLSPKQHFQSQVRELGGRTTHRHAQSKSELESVRHNNELHHVASLRVQHKRNAAPIPSTRRVALSESSHNLKRSQKATVTDVAVPDFSAEEREAWGKKSPRATSTSTRFRHANTASSSRRQLLLFPPPERLEPIPQPRKHATQSSLTQFEPLQTEADIERPKTSRGLPAQSLELPQTATDSKEQDVGIKKQSFNDAKSGPTRPSKFLEGSMNARSVGVASSWYHDNTSGSEGFDEPTVASADGTHTDSDTTPRASKPLPPTPAPGMTKKSIFRFGGGRNSEESAPKVEEVPKMAKERKGLRKSISVWNFHALGEKIFGGSASDTASEASIDTVTAKQGGLRKGQKTDTVAEIDILNERKRKAEEAYAQQFGVKKQKSNLGQSVSSTPSHGQSNKAAMDDKRPKTPTLRRKRDQRILGDHKQAAETISNHKRPSRRDLEKENQQLKSMLRETQSMTFLHSASLSSIDLTPKGQENIIRGPMVMLSPGKKQGRRGEDIPPVPKLPDEGILVEMQNRSGRPRLEPAMEKEIHASFETIDEGEEGTEVGKSKLEISVPEQWEWPEDVF